MSFELDHLFICASVGGPEAACLVEFGLTEGPPNEHPGQGTATRRFFFRNAMLELLWVNDSKEAQLEATRATCLWERWIARSDGACPFGLAFRPASAHSSEVPFSAWEYRPNYLPPSACFYVGNNSHLLTEPMLVYLPFRRRPEGNSSLPPESLRHATGFKELTRVELVSPHAGRPFAELHAVTRTGLVALRSGAEFRIELGFEGELNGKTADFSPSLPMSIHW
jgi:hypothetical protein